MRHLTSTPTSTTGHPARQAPPPELLDRERRQRPLARQGDEQTSAHRLQAVRFERRYPEFPRQVDDGKLGGE